MKLKTAALSMVYALLAAGAAYAVAQTETRAVSSVARANTAALPEAGLVDDLDRAVQGRFLRSPGFGMNRMGAPLNPHFDEFTPNTPEEQRAVDALQAGRWKVGLYLIGRRAYEKLPGQDKEGKKRLSVQYRYNRALPLTKNTKGRELAHPKRLRAGVDEAFRRFGEGGGHTFTSGKWAYVARPVRADASCLKCHTDLFVTIKPGGQTYSYRGRRVGDPVGVLVYAFTRKD